MKKKGISKIPHVPENKPFWGNLITTFLIFIILIGAYSYFVESQTTPEEISLSQLAKNINEDTISKIDIEEDGLDVTYKDGTKKVSKKEKGTALTDTLVNYGVTPKELAQVSINVKGPSAWKTFLVNVAPFLFPIIAIIIILWFLSRQVRGAGMQAFSFGQSKARVIDPNDTNQRVTFDDVAGAKEAKEELLEIVDFLKNPKKFIEFLHDLDLHFIIPVNLFRHMLSYKSNHIIYG